MIDGDVQVGGWFRVRGFSAFGDEVGLSRTSAPSYSRSHRQTCEKPKSRSRFHRCIFINGSCELDDGFSPATRRGRDALGTSWTCKFHGRWMSARRSHRAKSVLQLEYHVLLWSAFPMCNQFFRVFRVTNAFATPFQPRTFASAARNMADNKANELVSEAMKAEGGPAKGSTSVRFR